MFLDKVIVFLLLTLLHSSNSRQYNGGPTVDPGVFVITHIQSCRNGAGYCILGYSCEVDKDFMADDLGGNCDGLGAAFNPVTTFVCCRENPDNMQEAASVSNKGEDTGDENVVEAHGGGSVTTTTPTTTTTTSAPTTIQVEARTEIVTEVVTEFVTETEKYTEAVTRVESVTEIISETSVGPDENVGPEARIIIQDEENENNLRPGIVLDDVPPILGSSPAIENAFKATKPEANCFAAILMGLKCGENTNIEPENVDKTEVVEKTEIVDISSSKTSYVDDVISTAKTGLVPDRDEMGAKPMIVSTGESTMTPHTNTVQATVQVRNGDLIVSGDFVEEDIVPLKFKAANEDAEKNVEETGTTSDPPIPVKLFRKDDMTAEETFRTDKIMAEKFVADEELLSKLKSDLAMLKTTTETSPEPASTTTETPNPIVAPEVKPVVEKTGEPILPKPVTIVTETELVNLDLDTFDHSAEEPEVEAELKGPEVRSEPSADEDANSFFQSNCGQLGGSAVLQAFGRAAHNLLPDLVASWVTGNVGHSSGLKKSARLDDDELEPRIIGGDVTSTVLYCWMAAIVEQLPGDKKRFLCTGTLVKQDLIITSASCTHRLFERGIQHFKVILGDSNLNIDLPFGVQSHDISDVIIHENYKPEDSLHFDDIGLIKLKTLAKMENTICMLCLPPENQEPASDNCTVVGYGRPNDGSGNTIHNDDADATDGILRKADLPIVDTKVCNDFLSSAASSSGNDNLNKGLGNGFLCAGGSGEEESCFVAMDGGSPLSCHKNGRYELTGLVTYGTSCPHDRSPSLFTRVAKFSKWIRKNYLKMKRRR